MGFLLSRSDRNEVKQRSTSKLLHPWTREIAPTLKLAFPIMAGMVSHMLMGLADTVIVQVTLESHSDEALMDFGRALASIPEVLEAFLVSGDYDYYIRIAVSDTRDYERLLREQLYRIPGIRHSKSSFVLRQLKQSPLPLRR